MEILRDDNDKNIILNQELDFKTDAGWSENFGEFEKEALLKIINPTDNYETMRYIHEIYPTPTYTSTTQNDIWFYFYFYNVTASTHNNGTDYTLAGFTNEENANFKKSSTETFFRLEFYKTPNNEDPNRINRKLVFAKSLLLPMGEKYFYTKLLKPIHVPVFMGSNYVNKENMYLFWFVDESVFENTLYTGNTFWMSARFFNAKDGTISNFINSGFTGQDIVEERDVYYKVEIHKTGDPNRTDYSFKVFDYRGALGNRVGTSDNPIKFYELVS